MPEHRSGEIDPAMLLAIREEVQAAIRPLVDKLATVDAERQAQATALALLAQRASDTEAAKPTIGSKVLDAIIFWAVPIIGGSLLWLIKAAGQIPAGFHP